MFAPMDDATRTLTEAFAERYSLPKYRLRVIDGADAGREKVFDQRLIYVGSAPDNDLVLEDASVSRNHLKIEGEPIAVQERAPLPHRLVQQHPEAVGGDQALRLPRAGERGGPGAVGDVVEDAAGPREVRGHPGGELGVGGDRRDGRDDHSSGMEELTTSKCGALVHAKSP